MLHHEIVLVLDKAGELNVLPMELQIGKKGKCVRSG